MESQNRVSVIIAVYNAEPFIAQATRSAFEQPEVGEVILVEDGSTDQSLAECNKIVAADPERVVLLRHPGGENRGAGASWNRGVKAARFGFVAILGADDYFLPSRFSTAISILDSRSDIEGVYEAIGTQYESQEYQDYLNRENVIVPHLTTIREPLSGAELLQEYLRRDIGHFSLNGVTLRKSVFGNVGLFNENLSLSQDSEFSFRLIAKVLMAPGMIDEPVAVRRIHADNRFFNIRTSEERLHSFGLYKDAVMDWSSENLPAGMYQLISDKLKLDYALLAVNMSKLPESALLRGLVIRIKMLTLLRSNPHVFFKKIFWENVMWPQRIRKEKQMIRERESVSK